MGKLLQLAVFSPTPGQLVPLFVRAIVLNLSPSGCHLILTVRSLRHPFKIPGWRTYQVAYTFIRVEFLCRGGKTLPEIVCTPASDVRPPLCTKPVPPLNRCKRDKILLRFVFPRVCILFTRWTRRRGKE